jgi:hypothetical protein
MAVNQYATQYQWRDDPARRMSFGNALAAAKPPQTGVSQQATAAGAQPTQGDSMTGAPVANPWGMGGTAQRSATPFTVPGTQPQKPGSFAEMLRTAQPARQGNIEQAQKTISELFTPQGPSAEGQRQLSDFDKQAQEARRQQAEQSALSGRLSTGQIGGDNLRMTERLMAARADEAGKVAAADTQRADARKQQALSSLLSFEQLGQQSEEAAAQRELQQAQLAQTERLSMADLSVREKELAQNAQQFTSKQEFDRYALEGGWTQAEADRAWRGGEAERERTFQAGESAQERASRERLGFAGLSLQERELSQQSKQFTDKLNFDRWATQAGLDQQTAQRVWQSNEAERQRGFEASESNLDRAFQGSQFAQRLGLEKDQFTEQVRQFNSRQDFETWAKRLDVDQAEVDRVWNAQQQDIQRKWQSGERLSSQDHEILVEGIREKADLRKMERNQVLNLETLDKQQAFERDIEGFRQNYETMRAREGFSHEESMAQVQADIQQRLSAQGYTQDQALQAARIEADRINQDRDLEFQDRIQFARLAQENEQFWRNFGLDRKRVDAQVDQIRKEIDAQTARLDMDTKEFNALMSDKKASKFIEASAIMMEMYGDSPDMQQKSAELLWDGFFESGVISKEEYNLGKLTAKASQFKDDAAFTEYAKKQGADDATINAILEGKKKGTSVDATGKQTTMNPKVNELAEEIENIAPNGSNQDVQKWISSRGSDEVNINGTKAKVEGVFDTGEKSAGRQLLINVDGRSLLYDAESGKYSVYVKETVGNPRGGTYTINILKPFDSVRDAYSAWTIDPKSVRKG